MHKCECGLHTSRRRLIYGPDSKGLGLGPRDYLDTSCTKHLARILAGWERGEAGSSLLNMRVRARHFLDSDTPHLKKPHMTPTHTHTHTHTIIRGRGFGVNRKQSSDLGYSNNRYSLASGPNSWQAICHWPTPHSIFDGRRWRQGRWFYSFEVFNGMPWIRIRSISLDHQWYYLQHQPFRTVVKYYGKFSGGKWANIHVLYCCNY